MKVLLSIKPKYANSILNGSKRFEFRKKIFKKQDVKSVVLYATQPVGKVVGEFKVKSVLKASPQELWQQTNKHAGISKKDYYSYFAGCATAYAIVISNPKEYRCMLDLDDLKDVVSRPPQSFMYLRN